VVRGQHTARYETLGSTLMIFSTFGVKSAQLGRLPAEVLARMLLAEQIAERQA